MLPTTRKTFTLKFPHAISILLAAMLPTYAGAQAYTPLPEDCFPQLAQILSGVNETSPRIRMNAETVEESNAYLKGARSMRGLRVNSYARLQVTSESRIDSQTSYDDGLSLMPWASVNASVPIYHWGEFDARISQAKARISASKSDQRQQVSEVKQDIRRNFVEYQISMMAADIAQENIDYARRHHKAMSGLVERGISPEQTVADADIYEQERQEDLAQAQNQSENNLDILRQLTGEATLAIAKVDFPAVSMISADELQKLADTASKAYLPQLVHLDNELAAEEASYKEISSRNRPKIDAVAGSNLDSTDEYRKSGKYESVPRIYSWAGIQSSWTLYDSGSVNAEQLACLARQRRIKARIDEAKLDQSRQVMNIARDAELNKNRFETRQRKLELLKRTVSLMESQAESNSVASNDLFQRKQDLERTQIDLYRASAYYMLDIAQLRELAGWGEKK